MPTLSSYRRPHSIEEALQDLAAPDSVAFAGGALLLGQDPLPFSTLIDLQDVTDLQRLERTTEGLTIGGAVSLQTIFESPLVMPALKRSLARVVPLNIRNRTSVAESLMVEHPPREWLAALVATEARLEIIGPERDDLRMRTVENFVHYGDRLHQPNIVAYLYVPISQTRSTLGTGFVARTPADEPIVCTAACVTLNDAGKVLHAVAVVAGASALPAVKIELTTLAGNPLDEANIASAVKLVASHVEPVGDYLGSAEYRREMARVTAQRALLDCLAQLQ